MKSGDNRPVKPGRGPKYTIQGKLRDCAKAVISWKDEWAVRGAVNGLYQLEYFGKAMRGHMATIREQGLDVRPETMELVDKAEAILKEHCDSRDCSFKQVAV